jgi:hypothetical protein
MKYPQYRKLSNGQSFYIILNDRKFIEIQLLGSQFIKHTIEAEQYPELLRIQDMLHLRFPEFEGSTKEEVEQFF